MTIAVTQTRHGSRPEIEVTISAARPQVLKDQVAGIVTTMLGLDRDLSDFYRLARGDARLRELADRLRGMKPVRYPTVFEAFANAVTCQLVSLSAGMHVLNRLTEAFGVSAECRLQFPLRSFPTRGRSCVLEVLTALRAFGLSRQKGVYLQGLACGHPSERSRLSLNRAARRRRRDRAPFEFRGVGRWTAEYVMLRGFGRINIFPGDDVGGRNKLFEWFGASGAPTYDGVAAMLERWHPYGGLIYLHLIVNAVADAGHIAAAT